MSDYSLLISDLHLSPTEPALSKAFCHYCRDIANGAQALYILGDLSDAWIGDDDDTEAADMIRSELKTLVDSGTAVFLMTGNRDFLMGQQLANDCGLTLLDDPSVVDINGHNVLLTHGDSYCTDDAEYMAFRAQIQNPITRQMLMSKSLAERRAFAAQLRNQSKSANATKAADIMDVNDEVVKKAFIDHNVELMIHGHTHRPNTHQYALTIDGNKQNATRHVLGDWQTIGEQGHTVAAWQVKIDAQEIKLDRFELSLG